MNILFFRTLGMYLVYFKSLIKENRLTLREIWNKKEYYNLALYGVIFWILLLFVSFFAVIYFAENNLGT